MLQNFLRELPWGGESFVIYTKIWVFACSIFKYSAFRTIKEQVNIYTTLHCVLNGLGKFKILKLLCTGPEVFSIRVT